MPIIKCKMCGGDLNLVEGSTVCECEYCGTKQTVPSADNEKKLTLFSRAGRLLRACEFDKAAGVFETIVADFPQEAEAYWGLVLCKYGIEYVDDPATGKKIPTCHRSSFDSVLDDANFEQACENTDAVARRVYRDEARQIEELRQTILQVSGKEEPYDVFISYKETGENGDRTLDSVIAQDIYTELTEKGYRVFFSRISLEDKLGTEYEPYIFAALNSAKVMLVVGTDYENFDAVWVKNEWGRFLKLIAKGEKKTLIPVFKNMDAYDMPKEFAKLAAQDMGKVGAMQDLVRGVEKIVGKKKAEPVQTQPVQQVVQQTVVQGGGPNVQALLKRGQQALEDGDWAKAKGFYDQVLSMDAENADAFLGLALAGQQVRDLRNYIDTLFPGRVNIETDTLECDKAHIENSIAQAVVPGYCEGSELKKLYDFAVAYPVKLREETAATQQIKSRFNGDRNLSRAFRYAQGETKQKLETLKNELFDTLDKRVRAAETSDKKALEEAKSEFAAKLEAADRRAEEMSRAAQEKREADYQAACRMADAAKEDSEFRNASAAWKHVGNYKDATERAVDCEQKAAEIKARRERAEREAKEKAEAAKRKKILTLGIIVGAVVVAAIAAMMLVTNVIIPSSKYKSAIRLFEQGRYDEAIASFEGLGDYKDSKKQIEIIKNTIIDLDNQAAYNEACRLLTEGKYLDAESAFMKLGSFSDSADKAKQAKEMYLETAYQDALALLDSKDYTSAITAFRALGDYLDSGERLNKACYLKAEELLSAGKYDEAIAMFNSLGSYEDSKSRASEAESLKKAAAYSAAEALAAKGRTYEAAVAFYALKGYKDSWDRCFELWGMITNRETIAAGQYTLVGLKTDGTVVVAGDKNKYNPDGYLVSVTSWKNVVAVSAGGGALAAGLKADGTVLCSYSDLSATTSKWKDIVAISVGYSHIVGLKADGTVVAAGDNSDYQCNVSDWKDVIRIAAGYDQTIGLKADGTVEYAGWLSKPDWKNITDVYASDGTSRFVLGVKKDGTVLLAGDAGYKDALNAVLDWRNIVSVTSAEGRVFGLKSDGNVVFAADEMALKYNPINVSNWRNVVAISGGDSMFGLRSDGTILFLKLRSNNTNVNDSNIQEVTNWRNIAISGN